ncbi:MAG: alcohol dehydrogenase-like regulatory protein ErcA [Thermoguttaceae bacterium]|jgi:alcohol dehydrogenase class IV
MRDEQMLSELRKFVAPEIVFGQGSLTLVGRYAQNFGATKILIVTDPGLIATGWTGQVERSLQAASIPYVVFDGVTPNPKDVEVMRGAEVCREENCDLLVSVGGGSPTDCAKGIGIVAGNDRPILEFEGVDEVPLPGPPLICVPTTAGSSADVSQFAIIVDSARKVKIAIVSKMIVPDVSLLDPVTTTTMPSELTAATGMDALTHAFEAYVSTASSPLTDLHALAAARGVADNLAAAIGHPQAMEYRTPMMMASLMSGLAFSNASLGAVHAMAHALGGLMDLPHGECNAILLRHVVDFNFDLAAEKYRQLGEAIGQCLASLPPEEAKAAILNRLDFLAEQAKIKHTLGDIGVTREQLTALAAKAVADPCLATNPKPATLEDLEAIYVRAFQA